MAETKDPFLEYTHHDERPIPVRVARPQTCGVRLSRRALVSTALISVVLPTRNRADTLMRAIRSVLAQSHAEIELIVVDDASTDGTAALLAGIDDPRLRVLRNDTNLGVSGARNRGVHEARGAWIAFQDSDDEWRLDKLARQYAAVREDTVLVLCGDVVVNDLGMSYMGVDRPEAELDITTHVVARIPGAPCWLARRDAVLAAGGFDTAMNCFEDWELALRLSERGRVRMINEPLAIRQRTPGSLFSTERNFIPNLRRIFARHSERLRRHPPIWAFYCNLLGQTLCQFDECREGRRWFVEALGAAPRSPRAWLNFAMSWLGSAAFRRYTLLARRLRARYAPPLRPALYEG